MGKRKKSVKQHGAPPPISRQDLDATNSTLTAEQRDYPGILKWIQRCLESHAMCHKPPENNGHLPQRLIDVGSNEQESEARLVDTQDIALNGKAIRYVTLSYVWGNTGSDYQPFTTTRSSIRSRQRGMPKTSLPKLFNEVMEVCRGIDVRYLWIDALCILQDTDNLEEWKFESMRMEYIYRNALCCIVATHASNPQVGLFVPKVNDPLIYPSTTLRPTSEDAVFWRESVQADRLIAGGAVGARAWCLQERYLSPRLLHFTSSGLIKECNHGLENDSIDLRLAPLRDGRHSTQRKVQDVLQDSNALLRVLYHDWAKLVHEYRKKALTRPSDALYAISGLAREIERVVDDTYVAGHWLGKLPQSLSWYVWSRDNTRPSLRLRAPTWSWASLETPIMWDMSAFLEEITPLVSLVEIYPPFEPHEDPKAGAIVLYGVVQKLGLFKMHEMNEEVKSMKFSKSRATFALRQKLLWDDDANKSIQSKDVYWLPLWRRASRSKNGKSWEETDDDVPPYSTGSHNKSAGGLLLNREYSEVWQTNIYSRVGYLSSDYEESELEESVVILR